MEALLEAVLEAGACAGGWRLCWRLVCCMSFVTLPTLPPRAHTNHLRLPTPVRPPTLCAPQDMQQAGRRFGSSSVQLQLVFKRPLHPFYPPSVQLVSPRFQGPILRWLAVPG